MPDRPDSRSQALVEAINLALAELDGAVPYHHEGHRTIRGVMAGLKGAVEDFERSHDPAPDTEGFHGEILLGMQLLGRRDPSRDPSHDHPRSQSAMRAAQYHIRSLLGALGIEYTTTSHEPDLSKTRGVVRPPAAGSGRPWMLNQALCLWDGTSATWHLLWQRSRREIDPDD